MLIAELLPCVVGRSDKLDRILSASSLWFEVVRLSLAVGLAGSSKGNGFGGLLSYPDHKKESTKIAQLGRFLFR